MTAGYGLQIDQINKHGNKKRSSFVSIVIFPARTL
jgi:hypothetical protein